MENVEEKFEFALTRHQSGDLTGARVLYESILRENQGHCDANHNYGLLLLFSGEPQKSIEHLQKAINGNPNCNQYWFSLIESLIRLGDYASALKVLERGEEFITDSARRESLDREIRRRSTIKNTINSDVQRLARKVLGLYEKGYYQEAIAALASNKDTTVKNESVLMVAGAVYAAVGDLDRSIESYNDVLKINPSSAAALNNIGVALKEKGNLEAAISSFRQAIRAQPDYIAARINGGVCLRSQGKYKESRLWLQQALDLDPESREALNNMALLLMAEGGFKDAIPFLIKSLQGEDVYVDALLNLSQCYLKIGEYSNAVNCLSHSVMPKEQKPRLDLALSRAYFASNDLHEAESSLQELLSSELDNQVYSEALNLYGLVQFKLGNQASAKRYLLESIDINPLNCEAWNNLGLVQKSEGDIEDASCSFENAIKCDGNNTESLANFGNLVLEKGDLNGAMQCFIRAFDADSTNSAYINNLLSIACQTDEWMQLLKSTIKEIEEHSKENLLSQVYLLIWAYMGGEWEKTRYWLSQTKSALTVDNLQSIEPGNRIFVRAYIQLIKHLLNEGTGLDDPSASTVKDIFVIGESHCLTYANRYIQTPAGALHARAKICFGIKTYHLSQQHENKYKSLIRLHMASVPENSYVCFVIGEIDCRNEEGFLRASKKSQTDISQLVVPTVRKYVEFVNSLRPNNPETLCFINVPAPLFRDECSQDENTAVRDVIQLFNSELRSNIQSSGNKELNVYDLSARPDGFSSEEYHCDDRHLSPAVLPLLGENWPS